MRPETAVPDSDNRHPARKLRRAYRSATTLDALVMTLLRRSNRPLTAYEIARRATARASRITPAQVYRVLDRLIEGSEVQRIELLSAYLPSPGEQRGFVVCRSCHAVQPFPLSCMHTAVQRLCRAAGFQPSRTIVESWGLCAECENAQTSRKERPMTIRMKGLLAFMMAAGAMMTVAPVDAAERQPGVLYDSAGKELGTLTVTDAPKGVLLRIEARGLPPGWHGMHFHEKADCSDAGFAKAGGHVHSAKPIIHGFLVEGANDAGDLANIHVHPDGGIAVELYSTLVSLDGRDNRPALRDTDGSALVIHANPDDYTTQPIGGAGERIACGVIP